MSHTSLGHLSGLAVKKVHPGSLTLSQLQVVDMGMVVSCQKKLCSPIVCFLCSMHGWYFYNEKNTNQEMVHRPISFGSIKPLGVEIKGHIW